jgi:integrase
LDVGTTKNGEGRVFPFTTELRRILDAQQQVAHAIARETGTIVRHVFCYTKGQKTGKGITESGFNKAWRKARLAAGCPGRIPHDFRRTAVRNLVRAAVPERVAMQLTGHKTRAVFERYNIVSPGDLRDAARRLDAFARDRTAAATGS